MQPGTWVHQIIEQRHQAWAMALSQAVVMEKRGKLLLLGSGTSYYLARTVAEVGLRAGLVVEARPSEAVLLDADVYLHGVTTVIVISRSGTCSEAIWAVEAARERSIHTVAVTCHADSPLGGLADQCLPSPQGEDDTVVMIRSFSSMLVALQASLSPDAAFDLAPYAHDLLVQAHRHPNVHRDRWRSARCWGLRVRKEARKGLVRLCRALSASISVIVLFRSPAMLFGRWDGHRRSKGVWVAGLAPSCSESLLTRF